MKTLTITNQKGGVGKSTTAAAIGQALTAHGKKVLFVDLDAQGNLSYTVQATGAAPTVYEVLTGAATADEAIQTVGQQDIIPSSRNLAGADKILTDTGKEYALSEALTAVQSRYDYCIIDTPPALGILTVNALVAATDVIIPAQADIFSLQAIQALCGTISTVKKYCNRELNIAGIVITRYSGRAVLPREIAESIGNAAEQIGTKLFDTRIRECIALKEAQVVRQGIFDYAPKSNAAADYMALTKEIIEEIGK